MEAPTATASMPATPAKYAQVIQQHHTIIHLIEQKFKTLAPLDFGQEQAQHIEAEFKKMKVSSLEEYRLMFQNKKQFLEYFQTET